MRKQSCVLLVLLLVLLTATAAAAQTPADEAAGFIFRNGITWESSPEDLAEAEGLYDVSGFFKAEAEHFTAYVLQGAVVGQVPATVSYYIQQNQLVAVWCSFMPVPAFDFDAWLEYYTGQYGGPAETDTATVAALCNTITPGALEESEISAMAGWLLADGTYVYLLDLEGDLGLFCFNAPVLMR